MEQVVGRVVRMDSHIHLPAEKRVVQVFVWKSVINNSLFNRKSRAIRKENWQSRFLEMSDWGGDFGSGLAIVDPNYKRKLYSPDDYAYLQQTALRQSDLSLRNVLQENSIESNQRRQINASIEAQKTFVNSCDEKLKGA